MFLTISNAVLNLSNMNYLEKYEYEHTDKETKEKEYGIAVNFASEPNSYYSILFDTEEERDTAFNEMNKAMKSA